MVLANFDELLSKLGETEGKALPFSLLRPDEGTPAQPQESPGVFDAIGDVAGGINKARESGLKLGQDLAAGIKEGIGGIFGQEPSKEKKKKAAPKARVTQPTATAPPLLKAAPLQGGSTQLPQQAAQASGTDRIQQILDQQVQFRNQIRNRR